MLHYGHFQGRSPLRGPHPVPVGLGASQGFLMGPWGLGGPGKVSGTVGDPRYSTQLRAPHTRPLFPSSSGTEPRPGHIGVGPRKGTIHTPALQCRGGAQGPRTVLCTETHSKKEVHSTAPNEKPRRPHVAPFLPGPCHRLPPRVLRFHPAVITCPELQEAPSNHEIHVT